MAVIGVPNLKATGIAEDTSRSKRWRDALLKDVANEGVRFLFDLGFPYSYPGGAQAGRPAAGAPLNGAGVGDVSDHANGSVAVGTAGGIAYSGSGLDFTNSAAGGVMDQGVIAPASVMADLYAAYGGKSQRYLFAMYVKLTTLANWNASAVLLSIMSDKAYTSQPSLFTLAETNANTLSLRRQTTAATAESGSYQLAPTADEYGAVCQLAFWRNDAGQGLSLRRLGADAVRHTSTRTVGADNDQNFAANSFCFGRAAASFAGSSSVAVIASMSGFRVYRGWIENLARSGRDPVTVLDADWARVLARGAFS